jgi:retron-type reverse transcriptase
MGRAKQPSVSFQQTYNLCIEGWISCLRLPESTHSDIELVLKLIRGFLTAAVLADGLVSPIEEGTLQGGPLSPLLSNLMLDVLDKELEKRGHRFVLRR